VRCKHQPIHHGWSGSGYWYEAPYLTRADADASVCATCGAWLSLGPSNDSSEAVRIEIRAAELARHLADADALCDWTFGDAALGSDEERRGWSIAESNMQHHSNQWLAGHLARVIATHADTSEEGA
jgi:hypothetical protein